MAVDREKRTIWCWLLRFFVQGLSLTDAVGRRARQDQVGDISALLLSFSE